MPRRNYLPLAMIGSISLFCWQATQAAKPKDEMLELYGLFVDAVEKVEVNYVRPVSRRELLDSALEGMLQQLDPHSTFIDTSGWTQFRSQIEGRFGGIGIQVDVDPETARLRVVAPMVGTPAYEAGILAGDQIVEIDGQSAEGMSPDKAVEVLTGRPGTEVKLSVLHEGTEEPDPITITRAIIDVPSILGDHRKPDDQWEFLIDKDRKIGYIRITSFIQNTAEDLKKVAGRAQGAGDARADPRPARRSRRAPERRRRGRPTCSWTTARSSAPRAGTRSPRPSVRARTAHSGTCRWSCWSTRIRPRPPRSSRRPSRTTTGRRWSASAPTARARSRTSSSWTTATAC